MSNDEAEPTPPTRPAGRAGASMRDLVGAIVVLLLIVGAMVTVSRACSFSPGGPTIDPNAAPTVDAATVLTAAAESVDFAVRSPVVPAGWRANSSSTAPVGSGASANVMVRVGWLTPTGRFVQLSQSGGERADVLAADTGLESAPTTGEVDVDGVRWTTYAGRRDEPAWVSVLDGVTVLITGTGVEEEFRALAAAVRAAKPLPRGR